MSIRAALRLGRSLRRALLTPLALVPFVAGCSSAPKAVTPATAVTTDRAPATTDPARRSVETFDVVWKTVRDSHFDKTLNGVDWIAVRDELRPRAIAATTQDESRAVLMDMLSRLGQSHFNILPHDVAERSASVVTAEEQIAAPTANAHVSGGAVASTTTAQALPSGNSGETAVSESVATNATSTASSGVIGVSGIDIALVEGAPVVLRVTPNLAGAKAGVAAGWELVSVEGVGVDGALAPMRELLATEIAVDAQHARALQMELANTASAMLHADAGETRRATFRDADGGEHAVAITFEAAPYGSTQFGNLPPLPVEVDSRLIELPQGDAKPVRIGVISFNIWMTAASAAIDRAVDAFRSCDGIVLDLRGNPGGVGAMSMGVAGHFLREPASLGSMIGRDTTLEFKASPRKVSTEGKRVRPYTKPLAIIVDGRSASTSEVFAGGLQDLKRARVFGENSAGMALPAVAIELPSGDVLLHAVADFVTSSGARIEGRGVVPDERVSPTRALLAAGRDPAIDAAAQWISTSTLAARAAKKANAENALNAAAATPTEQQ